MLQGMGKGDDVTREFRAGGDGRAVGEIEAMIMIISQILNEANDVAAGCSHALIGPIAIRVCKSTRLGWDEGGGEVGNAAA